jgi:GTP cyclohydrolase II
MIRDFGVKPVDLMTTNPDQLTTLVNTGIPVNFRLSTTVNTNKYNVDPLNTKKKSTNIGHLPVLTRL